MVKLVTENEETISLERVMPAKDDEAIGIEELATLEIGELI
jgi:hypothetical protein